MSRWDSSTNETAAESASVVLAVLAELQFSDTDYVRVHTGLGQLTHNGDTYEGVGQLGGIELDAEDAEIAARGARLTLSGIPGHLVPDVLAESDYQGRPAVLYIGLIDVQTGTWVDTPEVLWSGQMDHMDLETGQNGARVLLHVEDELIREPLQAWCTDEDQQLVYPGDRFFADLPNVSLYKATWGQKPSSYTTQPVTGGNGGHGPRPGVPR